jgi:hypothetical protein
VPALIRKTKEHKETAAFNMKAAVFVQSAAIDLFPNQAHDALVCNPFWLEIHHKKLTD